ncbi:MAG: sugar transferase [Bacteroidaceae bacterium]|nr:sugar transferase [Bacteroidaceae bacterium]
MYLHDIEDNKLLRWSLTATDALLTGGVCWGVVTLLDNVYPLISRQTQFSSLLGITLVSLLLIACFFPPTPHVRLQRPDKLLQRTFRFSLLHTLFVAGAFFAVQQAGCPRALVALCGLALFMTLAVVRLLEYGFFRLMRRQGRSILHLCYIGNPSESFERLRTELARPEHGCQLECIDPSQPIDITTFEKLPNAILCEANALPANVLQSICNQCRKNGVRYIVMPASDEHLLCRQQAFRLQEHFVVSPLQSPLSFGYNRLLKRAFDLVVSSVVLLTVFPVFYIVAAFLIKRQSPGHVLVVQRRQGPVGKPFGCVSFRSVHTGSDLPSATGEEHDPRWFRFGTWLRRTGLDAFPQFLNVWQGDLSLVGPAPLSITEAAEFQQQAQRYYAPTAWSKAGIRSYRHTEDRVLDDLWYTEHWNIWLDIVTFFKL